MERGEINLRLSDPKISDTFCFLCPNNQISTDYLSMYLIINGVNNTDDEKRKIMTVVCQLLHVEWDIVRDEFSDNVHFPFCDSCLKSVVNMIGLREQLLRIEHDVQENIKQIESSIAKSYNSQEQIDQLESMEIKIKHKNSGCRQNFQHRVMKEYWRKELLRDKIEELNQIQNNLVEDDFSPIQLQLENNAFQIVKNGNQEMCSEGSHKVSQTDDNITLLENPLDRSPLCEVQLDYTNSQDSEFNFRLVCPTNEIGGSDDNNLKHGHQTESPMPTINVCNVNEALDSDDSKNDPDYELPSKKSSLAGKLQFEENTLTSSNGVESSTSPTSSDNLMECCDCGATDANVVLVCKYCRKRASQRQQKIQHVIEIHKSNGCPFCPAKFSNLTHLEEHARKIHFPSDSVKEKKDTTKESAKSGLDGEDKDDKIGTGIYDPEEMDESLSEEELIEPILAGITSGESSSEEEEKIITVAKPLPAIRGRRGSQRKRSTSRKKSRSKSQKISNNALSLTDGTEYIAKDKTVWTTIEPSKTKTRKYNILRENGKLLGRAADSSLTPAELFKLMISPDIVDLIVKYTNMFGESLHSQDPSPDEPVKTPCRDTFKAASQVEIYGFIGILLYFGLEKKSKTTVCEAWNSNSKYSIPCIAATMSRTRFQHFTQFLRFDDQMARRKAIAQGVIPEKLSYVSEIFNPFVENIGSHLQPYGNLVVDEMLVKFRGSSKFRVYMKSKPGRYGIKIWACCDTETGYILRLIIYEGKQGDSVETELGRKVVLGLVKSYFGTGRGVTTDNFFTSKALAHDLMKQNMSLLGTLNKNRMDVIPEFAEGKGRALESSIFAFQKDLTMVSYIPRKNRSVVLMSTQHHSIDVNPEIKNKPQIILDYNKTKGAVDTADQMIGSASCQRRTNRWPMKLFFAMCDIAALNAYYIWKIHQKNSKKNPVRLHFLRMLSEALMGPLVKARAEVGISLHTNTKLAMEMMGFPVVVVKPEIDNLDGRRGRCLICRGNARKSTRNICRECTKWICKEHTIMVRVCVHCYETTKEKGEKYTIKELVKSVEEDEETFLPIIDLEPDIYTTPIKRSTKEQNQLPEFVNRMELRVPRKKIETITTEFRQNNKEYSKKFHPKRLFDEVDMQEHLSKSTSKNLSNPVKHRSEQVQLQPTNSYLTEHHFQQSFALGCNLQTNTFVNHVPTQYQQDIISSHNRMLTTRPSNEFTSTDVGKSRQIFLYESNSQPKPTAILPPIQTQFSQSRHTMASPNLKNPLKKVSIYIPSNDTLTAAGDPQQFLPFASNMISRSSSASSVRKTRQIDTLLPTKETNMRKCLLTKPQVNNVRGVHQIDLYDFEETELIAPENDIREACSVDSDDNTEFEEYDLR